MAFKSVLGMRHLESVEERIQLRMSLHIAMHTQQNKP